MSEYQRECVGEALEQHLRQPLPPPTHLPWRFLHSYRLSFTICVSEASTAMSPGVSGCVGVVGVQALYMDMTGVHNLGEALGHHLT
jgi:hypothetical protein